MSKRKLFYRDGNDACLRISKLYSLAFCVYSFKLSFSKLFRRPTYKDGIRYGGGSMWWETLSIWRKVFDFNYGLISLFTIYWGHEVRSSHGKEWWYINLCFLPLSLIKYYPDIENKDTNIKKD